MPETKVRDFSSSVIFSHLHLHLNLFIFHDVGLKASSFALLISRSILRLGQAAQKQQRPRCPKPKMYLEIRRADERLFNSLILLSLVS